MQNGQPKTEEIRHMLANNIYARAFSNEFTNFLSASEYQLISYMVSNNVWQGAIPPPPPGYPGGDIEFGLMLYWFNNPDIIAKREIEDLVIILRDLFTMSTAMTAINYGYLSQNKLVYADGSMLGTGDYETYDQGWIVAFYNLMISFSCSKWYNDGQLPSPSQPLEPIRLSGSTAGEVNIAMLGDWGTGDATAKAVMARINNLKPDYIIHVGDVYYSGSPKSDPLYAGPGEEASHLINLWPTRNSGRSFTLNSNHEMYCGANGYFTDALLTNGSDFSSQLGYSYFALQYGGWTLLGLDSAFLGTSLDAFMSGSIGGTYGIQSKWIQGLQPDPAKTIVLTHHNGIQYDASGALPLWNEIRNALKGDPYAWYWGHVHNGIVYKAPLLLPDSFKANTYARCLGHAALPFGNASALENNELVDWYENNRSGNGAEVSNGFVMLTLSSDTNGQLTSIKESFYDLSKLAAVWTKEIYRVPAPLLKEAFPSKTGETSISE